MKCGWLLEWLYCWSFQLICDTYEFESSPFSGQFLCESGKGLSDWPDIRTVLWEKWKFCQFLSRSGDGILVYSQESWATHNQIQVLKLIISHIKLQVFVSSKPHRRTWTRKCNGVLATNRPLFNRVMYGSTVKCIHKGYKVGPGLGNIQYWWRYTDKLQIKNLQRWTKTIEIFFIGYSYFNLSHLIFSSLSWKISFAIIRRPWLVMITDSLRTCEFDLNPNSSCASALHLFCAKDGLWSSVDPRSTIRHTISDKKGGNDLKWKHL